MISGTYVFRSAPEKKASPTPVMIATHAWSSAANRSHASRSALKWSMSAALRASGRSMVMVTMCPSFA